MAVEKKTDARVLILLSIQNGYDSAPKMMPIVNRGLSKSASESDYKRALVNMNNYFRDMLQNKLIAQSGNAPSSGRGRPASLFVVLENGLKYIAEFANQQVIDAFNERVTLFAEKTDFDAEGDEEPKEKKIVLKQVSNNSQSNSDNQESNIGNYPLAIARHLMEIRRNCQTPVSFYKELKKFISIHGIDRSDVSKMMKINNELEANN